MRMPRLILVTRNFPPLWGGMERLNQQMAIEISKFAEVWVVAPRGAAAAAELPDPISVVAVSLSPLPLFLTTAALQTILLARRVGADVILAGSGLTAPIACMAARISGARAFTYVHGYDLAAPHPVYRTVWGPFFRRLDGLIVNSRATRTLALGIGVPAARIHLIHPGVTLPDLDPRAGEQFRDQYGLDDRPLMLSVGRLTRRKGLVPFVRDVLPLVVSAEPTVCLLIVGDVPRGALAAHAVSPSVILKAARAAGVAENVRWLGFFPPGKRLTAAFSAADVHVFPTQSRPHDPEGFGMVAVEAAAHGVPTVAYAAGGVVDAVADGVSGRLVAEGDHEAFAQAILAYLRQRGAYAKECRRFAEGFTWTLFGEKMRRVLLANNN